MQTGPGYDLIPQKVNVFVVFVDMVGIDVGKSSKAQKIQYHPKREYVGLGSEIAESPGRRILS